MKLTKAEKVRLANFQGHEGRSDVDAVTHRLVKKGLMKVDEGGFLNSITWTPKGKELGEKVREELAQQIRPKLSDEAVEALMDRRFVPELWKHRLAWERGNGKLMREALGLAVTEIIKKERA